MIKSITRSFIIFQALLKNDANLVKLIFRLYILKVIVKTKCKVEILVLLNLHRF